ncbi:MAG: superoxide dismutase family protein [Calditrichaeota bacterium]|nr:superoxide dismutase family protein [Calditrichota bacterium]
MKTVRYTGWLLALLLVVLGCAREEVAEQKEAPRITRAIAVLHPTEGSQVSGVVTFTRVENGVQVVADVKGLSPGKHGFHIHEFGDCSDLQAKSAGGHFNPTNMPHGAPDAEQHHIGDLGNLVADENGEAHLERVYSFLTLEGPNSIIGRAVIVHHGEDDFTTQPTGGAGARAACGVIGIAKP